MLCFARIPFLLLSMVVAFAGAAPLGPRSVKHCYDYQILSARGTYEAQGPSRAFGYMISHTLTTVPNGVEYDVVYPAAASQNSTLGEIDVVHRLYSYRSKCPSVRTVLLGYSQGAALLVNAASQLDADSDTAASIDAIIVVGNPKHRAGLSSNIDLDGGATTRNVSGISAGQELPTPLSWDKSGKFLDVCNVADPVCTSAGLNLEAPHVQYGYDDRFQRIAGNFLVAKLNATLGTVTRRSDSQL